MRVESIWQAEVQQRVFRELIEAWAHPGEIRDLAHWVPDATAHRAVLATLVDGETTLADPHEQLAASEWPLLQAKRDTAENAGYVIIDGALVPDFQPALGSLESPEFGATLLVGIDAVGSGPLSVQLAGPGISGLRELRLNGLHPDWLNRRTEWNSGFPLGVDLLFCDTKRVVALPRTTQISVVSGGELR